MSTQIYNTLSYTDLTIKKTMNKAQKIAYCPAVTPLDLSGHVVPAGRKYAEAVELYATTGLPMRCIAEICEVTPRGLSAYIGRNHRQLLYARYGLNIGDCETDTLKIRPVRGQSYRSHIKYKDAIEACGDIAYIEYNVSQIARLFGLSGPALSSQLRVHYPDVIPARERLRKRLGLADNAHRGARKISNDVYEEALRMYRNTDMTIPQVAEKCDVSKGGLVQYMRFYHKEIIKYKEEKRCAAKESKSTRIAGQLSGNGRLYGPKSGTVERYAPAVELYRTTFKSIPEIAAETGVSVSGLRNYLKQWQGEAGKIDHRRSSKASDKYAAAIASLSVNARPVASVAAEYGLNPDVFRRYLKTNAPHLIPSACTAREKYKDAVNEYATTSESLKNIAQRHGLVYNSLLGYILRNCPHERDSHQKIVEQQGRSESDREMDIRK